jgi:hypothetical protein
MLKPRSRVAVRSNSQLATLQSTAKSYDVADPAVAGLLLRIDPDGFRRWLLRFRWKNERTSFRRSELQKHVSERWLTGRS